MVVNDFHPVSIIGVQYKILEKDLDLRIAKVFHSVVSREQTKFVQDRQILDGQRSGGMVYKRKKER